MSLSWRKRQAQASDQKSWRALGTDSALWKGIEKNSGNVKVALGGSTTATTEGIVTGLKITKTETALAYPGGNTGSGRLVVSDPSNETIAATIGVNQFDTPYDASFNTDGTGLIFAYTKYGVETFSGSAIGTDISGCKFVIYNGGSGYKIGDTFTIETATGPQTAGDSLTTVTSVTSTKIEPGRN